MENLRKTFVDICNGFSVGTIDNTKVYIKHLTHRDHLDIEEVQHSFEEDAIKKGLPSEEQKLESLRKIGLWSTAKDNDITRQIATLERFEESKKKVHLPSVKKQWEVEIEKEKEKLNKLLFEKSDLIGLTKEKYSQKLINDFYIVKNIYKDACCKETFFKEDIFGYYTDQQVNDIVYLYNKSIDGCSEKSIRKLSIQDFFQSYYFLCNDDLSSFFGKPIIDLTFYQIRLGNVAKYYKHVFENNDISKFPADVRIDPDKLDNHINSVKETQKILDKNESHATSLVGATKQDLKELGLEDQVVKFPQKNMNRDEFINFMTKGGKV